MRTRIPIAASLAAVALTLLTACAPQTPTPEPTESYVPAPVTEEEPTEPLVPNVIEPDTVLIVRAVATAGNGATLSLEYQVHQSYPWDDIANQTLPAGLIQDCANLDAAMFAEGAWSFTRSNVTAIPAEGATVEWPTDGVIGAVPSASSVYTAGRGILTVDAATTDSPLCEVPKSFAQAGRGAMAIGIPGDAGRFTAWAGHRYGFEAASGVTLGECTVELTPLGSSLGGGAGWVQSASESSCSTGPAAEVAEY